MTPTSCVFALEFDVVSPRRAHLQTTSQWAIGKLLIEDLRWGNFGLPPLKLPVLRREPLLPNIKSLAQNEISRLVWTWGSQECHFSDYTTRHSIHLAKIAHSKFVCGSSQTCCASPSWCMVFVAVHKAILNGQLHPKVWNKRPACNHVVWIVRIRRPRRWCWCVKFCLRIYIFLKQHFFRMMVTSTGRMLSFCCLGFVQYPNEVLCLQGNNGTCVSKQNTVSVFFVLVVVNLNTFE